MFRVEWLQVALDELARIWINANPSLRRAITTATHIADQELQTDPVRLSESRDMMSACSLSTRWRFRLRSICNNALPGFYTSGSSGDVAADGYRSPHAGCTGMHTCCNNRSHFS